MKIIYLEWIDASSRDEWLLKEELEEWLNKDNHKITSVGFLLSESKDHYLIVQNYNVYEMNSMAMKIPKKYIIKKRFLTNK